jgi:hypothetical protein
MADVKQKKSWYKSWWAITLFIIIGLIILGGIFGGNKNNSSQSSLNNEQKIVSEPANSQATQNTKPTVNVPSDVWSKTSGYSVEECYEVCDGTYDIQAQVTVCQGNCDMYGKPSVSLDKYVNTVKDIKNKK